MGSGANSDNLNEDGGRNSHRKGCLAFKTARQRLFVNKKYMNKVAKLSTLESQSQLTHIANKWPAFAEGPFGWFVWCFHIQGPSRY